MRRSYQPTPAWVVIGFLTSFLILILQITLYAHSDTRYAAFIVSLTYTSAILFACSLSLVGHLLVGRFPVLDRFLNVDIDIASVMTGTWGGGGARGGGGKSQVRGRNRASVGGWIANTVVVVADGEGAEPGGGGVEPGSAGVERPELAMVQRGRSASDTSSEEAEWRATSARYVAPS